MRKLSLAVIGALALTSATPAQADVGFLFGLTVTTGGAVGVNASALTSDRRDRWVAAGGLAFYPLTQRRTDSRFGVTLGGGYHGDHWAGIAGWDILQNAPFAAAGYATTD